MTALLALVATVIITVFVAFVDLVSGGLLTRSLPAAVPAVAGQMACVLVLYAICSLLAARLVTTARLVGGDEASTGVLEEFLWLDHVVRHDYGRWPLALSALMALIALASLPGVLTSQGSVGTWALYVATAITLVRTYQSREKLRDPSSPKFTPTLGSQAASELRGPAEALEWLRGGPSVRDLVSAQRSNPPRTASLFPIDDQAWTCELRPEGLLHSVFASLGIEGLPGLYAHQLGALKHILTLSEGESRNHVVLATGPGSGKGLTIFLAMLERTLRRGKHVLVVCPDQSSLERERARFHDLANRTDWRYALHEGAIAPDSHDRVPDPPHEIVYCSVDTLHAILLKNHRRWSAFFSALDLVVVHDIDRYTGVVGANTAQVFRRLRQITRDYGQQVQYVATGRPTTHLSSFAAELLSLVAPADSLQIFDVDGSPRPDQIFTVWAPPEDLNTAARQTVFDILARLSSLQDFRLLVFAPGSTVEVESRRDMHAQLVTDEAELGSRQAHYDGLLILSGAKSVEDIARLTGRLGLERNGGLTIVVADQSASGQRLARSVGLSPVSTTSAYTFEPLLPLNVQHGSVIEKHLACSIVELRPTLADVERTFGQRGSDIASEWLRSGRLRADTPVKNGPLMWAGPAREDLHSRALLDTAGTTDESVEVRTPEGQVVLRVDADRAACEVYPDRQVLVGRRPYVIDMTSETPVAVAPTSTYQESAVPVFSYCAVLAHGQSDMWPRGTCFEGSTASVSIARRMVSVQQTQLGVRLSGLAAHLDGEIVREVRDSQVAAFVADAMLVTLDDRASPGVAHTLAHLFRTTLRAQLPERIADTHLEVVAVDCVNGWSTGACVLIYDSFDAGMGMARTLEPIIPALLLEAYHVLASCPCQHGCAACVEDLSCRQEHTPATSTQTNKTATLNYLREVLGHTTQQLD
jgi:DEAD/DEAH box helicase domain-containing protein